MSQKDERRYEMTEFVAPPLTDEVFRMKEETFQLN